MCLISLSISSLSSSLFLHPSLPPTSLPSLPPSLIPPPPPLFKYIAGILKIYILSHTFCLSNLIPHTFCRSYFLYPCMYVCLSAHLFLSSPPFFTLEFSPLILHSLLHFPPPSLPPSLDHHSLTSFVWLPTAGGDKWRGKWGPPASCRGVARSVCRRDGDREYALAGGVEVWNVGGGGGARSYWSGGWVGGRRRAGGVAPAARNGAAAQAPHTHTHIHTFPPHLLQPPTIFEPP